MSTEDEWRAGIDERVSELEQRLDAVFDSGALWDRISTLEAHMRTAKEGWRGAPVYGPGQSKSTQLDDLPKLPQELLSEEDTRSRLSTMRADALATRGDVEATVSRVNIRVEDLAAAMEIAEYRILARIDAHAAEVSDE